jgi:hypothetical protein
VIPNEQEPPSQEGLRNMNTRARFLTALICVATLFGVTSSAQTPEGRRADAPLQTAGQSPGAGPTDPVANEVALLRKSLQTLNTRLREISEKLFAPEARQGGTANENQKRIALNLDLLTRAEQRAELLRKQLLELIEKETVFRNRLVQIDEDLRPDSIDRSISLVGSTRTPEVREVRRRVLENERKGFEGLLAQTAQSRVRLDDDVKQADLLVAKLRARVLPLIEKEIDKIIPGQP